MRFLANENFPGAAVKLLQSAGSDIVWEDGGTWDKRSRCTGLGR